MNPSAAAKTLLFFVLIVANSWAAEPMVIQLSGAGACGGSVVRLGDVAVIRGGDSQQAASLSALQVCPAPLPGRTRRVTAAEIRELLTLSGWDLSGIRFGGAAAVLVGGSSEPSLSETPTAGPQARQRAERAILNYLVSRVGNAAWEVEAQLDPAAERLLSQRLSDVQVEGGRAPWTGRQEFTLATGSGQRSERTTVTADVRLPDAIVTAARPLAKGQALAAADVALLPVSSGGSSSEEFPRVEDVIGLETVRAIATGQPILQSHVQRPRLVQRREIVTVFARAAGVQVRTNAVALGDGAQDDLVEVETLADRRRLVARVIGYQEVEIFARGPSLAGSDQGASGLVGR